MYPRSQRTKPEDHPLLLTADVEMVATPPGRASLWSVPSGSTLLLLGVVLRQAQGLWQEEHLPTLQGPVQRENAGTSI